MGWRRSVDYEFLLNFMSQKIENINFKFKFGLRGYLDIVCIVIFFGGGSFGEFEICIVGDDGMIK